MDLQIGDRITYKNSMYKMRQVIIKDEEQKNKYKNDTSITILKIERPQYEIIEEKKGLLTEEKEFLKQYIKLIESLNNGEITNIYKQSTWIIITLKTKLEYQAEIGPRFKGMKDCKPYTLSELGLEE